MDIPGDGDRCRARLFYTLYGFENRIHEQWNNKYSNSYRIDPDDVPPTGQSKLQTFAESVQKCKNSIYITGIELDHWPDIDVHPGFDIPREPSGLYGRINPDRFGQMHCDGIGME